MKRLFLMIMVVVIAIGLVGCNIDEMRQPVDSTNDDVVVVTVPRGATTTSIATLLMENELIQSEMVFKMVAKELGADGKMQAGDYELMQSMSTDDIINKLVSGDVVMNTFSFTIPEGFELKDITSRLVSEGHVNEEKFVEALGKSYDYKFLEGQESLEGFLFPDTYEMKIGATEEEIIDRMLKRFDEILLKIITHD